MPTTTPVPTTPPSSATATAGEPVPVATHGAAPLAVGKVTAAGNGRMTFVPANTNYELDLICLGYAGPLNRPVRGTIRVTARKIWTVPAGGNFIAPIFGPPKTIQGRVRSLDAGRLVVQAGVPITVELPDEDRVYDLANGPIAVGEMVNVTAFAGGTFEAEGGGQRAEGRT